MRMILGSLFGAILLTSQVGAMPIHRPEAAAVVQDVKVICNEAGRCYRPPARRPVARWEYGDNNFVGPYAGPGYYGSPQYRYKWWPFFW